MTGGHRVDVEKQDTIRNSQPSHADVVQAVTQSRQVWSTFKEVYDLRPYRGKGSLLMDAQIDWLRWCLLGKA